MLGTYSLSTYYRTPGHALLIEENKKKEFIY